jgi:hypothetical protein
MPVMQLRGSRANSARSSHPTVAAIHDKVSGMDESVIGTRRTN